MRSYWVMIDPNHDYNPHQCDSNKLSILMFSQQIKTYYNNILMVWFGFKENTTKNAHQYRRKK